MGQLTPKPLHFFGCRYLFVHALELRMLPSVCCQYQCSSNQTYPGVSCVCLTLVTILVPCREIGHC